MAAQFELYSSDSEPDNLPNGNPWLNTNEESEGESSSSEFQLDETSRHGHTSRETSTSGKQSETTNDNLRLKRRFGGAFKYKTKFQKSWTQNWPFVSSVPSDKHKFRCNVCAKVSWL
jgi:D-aminopeptidase